MFDFLKKKKPEVTAPIAPRKQERRFVAASSQRANQFAVTYARINNELRSDYIALVLRARELAKNNEIVSSYLNLMRRNVIGSHGFALSVTSYTDDNKTADVTANRIIEDCWYDYCTSVSKYVDASGQLNALDFDKLVLSVLLVDGEVFIRKSIDNGSKYRVRYEVIDSLDVDVNYNVAADSKGTRIIMGIKVDSKGKPLAYYIRSNRTDYYASTEREEVQAKEIIHIYRREFAGQVRGFSALAPVILNLKGMEEYKNAEINAALINANYMGVWERTGAGDPNKQFTEKEQAEIDATGNVAVEIESNVFRYAPDGYQLKSIQSLHPNGNMGAFEKCCIKGVASSLGVSSNKLNSDYESVNYSSLRQANSEDINAWTELQQFLIDAWKNVQYNDWLQNLLLGDIPGLSYARIDAYKVHDFRGRSWEYLDPVKEYSAIKMRLEMRLTNPIIEIEKQGMDVDDVLNGWAVWQAKMKEKGVPTAEQSELTNAVIEKVVLDAANSDDESITPETENGQNTDEN